MAPTFEQLAEKYDYMLNFLSHKYRVHNYEPCDLKQVYLMVMWECFKRFDPARKTSFKTYLYASLIHATHKLLRKYEPRAISFDGFPDVENDLGQLDVIADNDLAFLLDDSSTPEENAIVNEHIEKVMGLIDRLSRPQKVAVVGRLLEGMTTTDIASREGVTSQSVIRTYERGISNLKKWLEEESKE